MSIYDKIDIILDILIVLLLIYALVKSKIYKRFNNYTKKKYDDVNKHNRDIDSNIPDFPLFNRGENDDKE